jgi:LysR family transcriptional regulator, regulator for bpeEF and oprC
VRIAEFGNITRAAQAMGVPKTKLSRNLALLEDQLKVSLAYRTTRSFRLTSAGEDFFRTAKEHLLGLEHGIIEVAQKKDEFKGTLKITAPEDFGNYIVTPMVAEFTKLHPFVKFELIYNNEVLDLTKLGIDLAFRIGNLKDSSLSHYKIGRIEFYLVASPSYLKSAASIKNPSDLTSHLTIGFSGGLTSGFAKTNRNKWDLVFNTNEKQTVKLQSQIESNNFVTIRNLAIHGAGVAFVPKFLCERFLESGELEHCLKGWTNAHTPVQALFPSIKNRTLLNQKFFEFSKTKISKLLQ